MSAPLLVRASAALDALPGLPAPHYAYVTSDDGVLARMAYLDERPPGGRRDPDVVVLLHGEPSWAYLYRAMVAALVDEGFRVLAPDLIGFGRSDKPTAVAAYSYARHVAWLRDWLFRAVRVRRVAALFAQDWGGLLGLRLVAESPEAFGRLVLSNTFLPTGDAPLGRAFERWRAFALAVPELPVAAIVQRGTVRALAPDELAAYDAPYPCEAAKAGARAFPGLVPAAPDAPGAAENRAAWDVLQRWQRPVVTCFGDSDPITRGADALLQALLPGAAGQPHTTVAQGGHFVQEDAPLLLARVIVDCVRRTPGAFDEPALGDAPRAKL
jgi:haloalkane dehalogenase